MTGPPRASSAAVAPAVDRLRDRPLALVGIGGRGCAGKTTLARSLRDVAVVGTDEFWDGTRFDLERLRREVIEPLRAGGRATYAAFDWAQGVAGGLREIEPDGVVVIEGVCALHRSLREAYDLRIWVETAQDVRLDRALRRDGPGALQRWERLWLPMEEGYVSRDRPAEAAQLVVPGFEEGGN